MATVVALTLVRQHVTLEEYVLIIREDADLIPSLFLFGVLIGRTSIL
jgi:hypothetical protein